MLDLFGDLAQLAKQLHLGTGGFFALLFLAIFVWGAKRAGTITAALNDEWRQLISEGNKARKDLSDMLDNAEARLECLSKENTRLQIQIASMQYEMRRLIADRSSMP